jgi:hypothetical protein
MAQGGVAPRVPQAAARHGDFALTMQRYTNPQLLDIAGALEVPPELPLGISHSARPEPMRATGTDDASGAGARTVAPNVAPDADRNQPSLSFRDHQAAQSHLDALDHEAMVGEALSADPDTKKGSLTIAVNEPFRVGATGR